MGHSIQSGEIIGGRYFVVYALGLGEWGHIYLVEDLKCDRARRVLKEFSPKPSHTARLEKTAQLCDREVQILAQLKHPQIPQFRESLRVKHRERECLFFVQDYVKGLNYRELLQIRQQQGRCFSEGEMIRFLGKILPVLGYIHDRGLVHGNLAPENLILRNGDSLPVPIDFGGIKQAIATAVNFPPPEKPGYAPYEQVQQKTILPQSDLYALAVTVLVLLTGREPQNLLERQTLDWDWQQVKIRPEFAQILQKMLATEARDRFFSATEVLNALNPLMQPTVPEIETPELDLPPYPPPRSWGQKLLFFFRTLILVVFFSAVAGAMGWFAGKVWIDRQVARYNREKEAHILAQQPLEAPETLSFPPKGDRAVRQAQNQALRDRCAQLGIDYSFFIDLIEEEEAAQERNFLDTKEDRAALEERVLEKLSHLSEEARLGLGDYEMEQREEWIEEVNQLHLSRKAFFDLADGKFFDHFPEKQGEDFQDRAIAQVWQGILFDTFNALQSGSAIEEIILVPGAFSSTVRGTLEPGTGKAFILRLEAGQQFELSLDTDHLTQLSLYSPRGEVAFLEDSRNGAWFGQLPEDGYYEIVLVSQDSEPLDYQLNFAIVDP
ncbi:protein kinase domain-containing protein [Lusitaniella coriacea]|uniref:protein kinase domain-containing protein n=1 Tax=Lusitaniella coriacea TaxID=1983105 RepID=UPI003CFA9B2A